MRRNVLVIALGLMLAGGTVIAQPQTPRRAAWMDHHPALLAQLKLTEQQKTQARDIWFNLQQKQIDVRAQLAHARLDYHELAAKTNPSQKSLNDKIQTMANLRAQLQQNKLDAWFAVNKILTAEQQKVWQKVLEHPMMFERRAMMNRRGHGQGMMRGRGMMGRPGMMQGNGSWQGRMGNGTPMTPPPPDSNN